MQTVDEALKLGGQEEVFLIAPGPSQQVTAQTWGEETQQKRSPEKVVEMALTPSARWPRREKACHLALAGHSWEEQCSRRGHADGSDTESGQNARCGRDPDGTCTAGRSDGSSRLAPETESCLAGGRGTRSPRVLTRPQDRTRASPTPCTSARQAYGSAELCHITGAGEPPAPWRGPAASSGMLTPLPTSERGCGTQVAQVHGWL